MLDPQTTISSISHKQKFVVNDQYIIFLLFGLMCRINYDQHNLNATSFKEGKSLCSNMLVHIVFVFDIQNSM